MSVKANWEDPSNGQTFVINQRTGNSYPRLRGVGNVEPIGISSSSLMRGNITLREGENTNEGDDVPGWLQEALEVRSHPTSQFNCLTSSKRRMTPM